MLGISVAGVSLVGGDCLVRVDGLFGNEGGSGYIRRGRIVVIWLLNSQIYVSSSHLGGAKKTQ